MKKNEFRISKHGLTLIELLLAVTIFSIVASIIYSSFRLGIVSWRRTEANLSRYQKIRHALNLFTEDLTNAFMYEAIPFKGEGKSIEFAGFIKDIDTKQRTIGRICYNFSTGETAGASGSLIRQQQEYWQIQTEEDEEAEQVSVAGEELLSDVMDFNINYCYAVLEEETEQLQWSPEWISEESIPAGVKLELVLKDDAAPEGKRMFAKRVYIPVGEIGNLEELEIVE